LAKERTIFNKEKAVFASRRLTKSSKKRYMGFKKVGQGELWSYQVPMNQHRLYITVKT